MTTRLHSRAVFAGIIVSGVLAVMLSMPATASAAAPAVTAADAVTYTLTIGGGGQGKGSVTSSPAGIDCGATCVHAFPAGTQVTLTANVGLGSYFVGWGGACSGTDTTCAVTLNSDTLVTASFEPIRPPVPTRCDVPRLKGRTLRWAKREIRLSHCGVGKITKVKSSQKNRGRVISQRPKPGGKRLPVDTKIALVVGK